jgi:Flp pilus assembly pilin Flp
MRPMQSMATQVGEEAMKTFLSRFLKTGSGITAVEYDLIAAVIWVALMAGFQTVRSKLSDTLNILQ